MLKPWSQPQNLAVAGTKTNIKKPSIVGGYPSFHLYPIVGWKALIRRENNSDKKETVYIFLLSLWYIIYFDIEAYIF